MRMEEKKRTASPSARIGSSETRPRDDTLTKPKLFPEIFNFSEPGIEGAWTARMIRTGGLLVVLTDAFYLAGAWIVPGMPWRVTRMHLFNLILGLIGIAFTFAPVFPRMWRPAVFALLATLVMSDATVGIASGSTAPTLIKIMLICAGTGALAPWEPVWQFAFGTVCLIAWAVTWTLVPSSHQYAIYQWSGVIFACAIAHFASVLRKRHTAARNAAERRLRDSEEKLRKVFEASLDTIAISRVRDGSFVSVSPALRAWGYCPADVIGTTALHLGIWENLSERDEFIRQIRENGKINSLEATFRRKDGSTVPCLIAAKIADLDGEACVVTVVRDITRLKETERALIAARENALKASQAKSEFVASLSHEIRTPMNAMLGMAELLMETPLSEEQRRYVKAMLGNGAALLDLLNDVLDLSRVESGQLVLEETGFDLLDLVERAVETFGVRAHEKHVEIAARVMPDVPVHLIGDPLRLRQVLVNLLGNAVKFTNQGHILLRVDRDMEGDQPGALRFSVEDTGIGIPADRLDHVFGRFSQADSSTARKYGGSGLGLSIVKYLVELLGGRVWVESEVGCGSTFRFAMRFKVDSTRDAGSTRAEPDLTGVKMLVVDDAGVNRIVLREMLSSRGARVSEVADGPGALAEVKRARREGSPYRVILLDYRMPRMDGIEMAERMREAVAPKETAILMLTSDDMGAQLERLRAAGFSSYVVKPVRRAELFQAVTRLLGESPGRESAPKRVEAVAVQKPPGAPMRPLRLLLAEDSPDNRLLIRAFLKKTPYTLDAVANGRQALEKFKEGKYDAILMDMQMPVMDGYAAVREMRTWEREHGLARTPVVALTGAATDEEVAMSADAGCDRHLSKPFKRGSLLAVIEAVAASTVGPASHVTASAC